MKKKNITIDDLAMMVQKGFEDTSKKIDETAKKKDVDKRFDKIDDRLIVLEKGHEEIRLRQDQMAYRFELIEVKQRLNKVERKLSLANR